MRPPRRARWLLALAMSAVMIFRLRRRTPAQQADDLRCRWM